jgi:hypothetical protein
LRVSGPSPGRPEAIAGVVPERAGSRRRWIRGLGAVTLAVGLSGLGGGAVALDRLRGASPDGTRAPALCSFRARTGLPCLGCGGTRALESMRHGDWRGALAANPLGAFVGVALWLLAAGGAAATATGRAVFVKAALAVLAALAPGAFVWTFVAWWLAVGQG